MKIFFKENKSRKNALLKDKYSSHEYETDLLEEINFFLFEEIIYFFSILNERLFTQA
jgi:hypothetical protein